MNNSNDYHHTCLLKKMKTHAHEKVCTLSRGGVHSCSPSPQKTEAETQTVRGKPGLHRETLYQKTKAVVREKSQWFKHGLLF